MIITYLVNIIYKWYTKEYYIKYHLRSYQWSNSHVLKINYSFNCTLINYIWNYFTTYVDN